MVLNIFMRMLLSCYRSNNACTAALVQEYSFSEIGILVNLSTDKDTRIISVSVVGHGSCSPC